MAVPKIVRFPLSPNKGAKEVKPVKGVKQADGVPIVNPPADPPADDYNRIVDLLANGSFEAGATGWYFTTLGGTIEASTAQRKHGANSLHIDSAAQITYARQDITLAVGDKVFVRGWCYLVDGSLTSGGIFMSVCNYGSMNPFKTLANASLDASWRYASGIATVQAGSTGIRIVAGRATSQTAEYHIDGMEAILLTGNVDPAILEYNDTDLLAWCETRYPYVPLDPPDPEIIVDPTWFNADNYGILHDGSTDDTAAINALITQIYQGGGGYLWLPDGIYMINAAGASEDGGVKPKDGVHLRLDTDATLQAIANGVQHYQVVWFSRVTGSSILGGKVKGERDTHSYVPDKTNEWGQGIRVTSSNNILVSGVDASDCTGDGIIVGGYTTGQTYSQNVILTNNVCHNNRRNGITIASAVGLTLSGGTLTTANGTNPQAGLDIEPSYITDRVQNILVENVNINNNVGWGFDWWFYKLIGSGYDVSIVVNDVIVANNGVGQIRYASGFTSANSYFENLNIKLNGVQIGNVAKYGA